MPDIDRRWDIAAVEAEQAFRDVPSEQTLVAYASGIWGVAEARGGVASLDVKQHLLAVATASGMEPEVARRAIDRAVPGPSDYEAVLAGEGVPARQGASLPSPLVLPIVTSTLDIPCRVIARVIGIVTGNTVRTRHLGTKIVAGVSSNFGGELTGFTKLLSEARDEASNRMLEHAMRLGAHAVVGFRFVISEFFEGSVEVLAYGTAVELDEVVNADGAVTLRSDT